MLEQMYLITVPKISVLEPNCWETTTEFSRHKSRIRMVVRPKVHPFWGSRMSHGVCGSRHRRVPSVETERGQCLSRGYATRVVRTGSGFG